MNKITKLLSVFIIAGAIGTGVAGVAGCNNGGKGGNGGGGDKGVHHTTSHELKYEDNSNGTHKVTCKVEGCDFTEIAEEDHVDANQDESCDRCHGEVGGQTQVTVSITTTATKVNVGKTLTLEATVTPAGTAGTITWVITGGSDYATIEGNVLTGVAVGDVTVKAQLKDGETLIAESSGKTINVAASGMYETLADREDNIIAEDFEDASKFTDGKLSVFGGSYNTAGVFYTAKNNTEAAYVKVEGGKAVQVDPGDNEEAHTIIAFGPTSGAIEGYMALSTKAGGTGWTPVQFYGSSAAKTNAEVIGLRNEGAGLGYRLDGGSAVMPDDKISLPAEGNVTVYFKFDPATKKMTLKVDNHVYLDDAVTTIDSIVGIKLVSSTGGAKLIHLDEVAINAQLMAIADYKATALAELTAERAKYDDADYRSAQVDELTAAVTTANTSIEGAETIAAVTEALNTAKAALKAVKTDLQLTKEEEIAKVEAELAKYSEENYSAENWTAIQTLVNNAKTAINTAETVDAAKVPMTTLPGALEDVPDKNTVSYAVTFVNTDITAVNVKSGETVSEPTAPTAANSEFKGWYTDDTYATPFDFENTTITAATNIYAKWVGVYNKAGAELDSIVASTTGLALTESKISSTGGMIDIQCNGLGEQANAGGEVVFSISGGTNSSRHFEIDLTGESLTGTAWIIEVVFTQHNEATTFINKGANSQNPTNNTVLTCSKPSSTYGKQTVTYVATEKDKYYFCNSTKNCYIHSISVKVAEKVELTGVTGTVTLGENDAIDLSAVTFTVADGDPIAATAITSGVTATLSEDKTQVTVSYGKITKVLDVTTAA